MDGTNRDGVLARTLRAETLAPGLVIGNRGAAPVAASLTLAGVPSVAPPAESAGYEITRSAYTLDGAEADLANVPQGERLVVVLDVLPVDKAPARLMIEQRLIEMARVDARFDLYAGALGAALGPAAAASLVSIVMMKGDGEGGFTPWRDSGKRECRWQPYAGMIEQAIS